MRRKWAKWAGNAFAAVFGVGMFVGLVVIFVWQPIDSAIKVYAIQNYPVRATQSAVVTEIIPGRGGDSTRVSYTTNTGESVSTRMCPGIFQSCTRFNLGPGDYYRPGSTVKVKYVSHDPEQVYPSDYEAGYGPAMIVGSFPLLMATLIAWSCWNNWAERRANRAAKKRQAPG